MPRLLHSQTTITLGLVVISAVVAAGQVQIGQESLTLRVIPNDAPHPRWEVAHASMDIDFQATWARITVGNFSASAANPARFYAEYLDERGRTVFSAGFVLDAPGLPQTLVCRFPGLAPAAKPVQIQVTELPDAPATAPPVAIPPTISSGSDMPPLPIRLIPRGPEAVIDLALLEIEMDSEGKPQNTRVVEAADSQSRAWFEQFGSRLRFYPSTRDEVRQPAKTLVLVRAQRRYKERETIAPNSAYGNDWVRRYTRTLTDIPVVNEARFDPEENWFPERAQSGAWMFVSLGSDWCPESFHWVAEPGHSPRRAWLPDSAAQPTLLLLSPP